jgi:hypothetical protein
LQAKTPTTTEGIITYKLVPSFTLPWYSMFWYSVFETCRYAFAALKNMLSRIHISGSARTAPRLHVLAAWSR